MAKVHVLNVVVLDNPAQFMDKLEFEITFESVEDLPEDLEWKIIYVGSAESEEYDQILDTVYVGPVPEGRHKFVFTADPPNPHKIPVSDVVGVTVILLECSYRSQNFIRVGYYVSNEYTDPAMQEEPPSQPQFDKLQRNILASNPRVTKFKINWEDPNRSQEPLRPDQDPARQVETDPSDTSERPCGISNVPPPRLPTAEEVENFPPDARPVPRNPLPPFKDPSQMESPIKKTLQESYGQGQMDVHMNQNSRSSDNLMEADFGS